MRRKQIYLDEANERALKRYLAPGSDHDDDPLERLIGLVPDETGPDDVAEEHDHYLYGAPKERA